MGRLNACERVNVSPEKHYTRVQLPVQLPSPELLQAAGLNTRAGDQYTEEEAAAGIHQ